MICSTYYRTFILDYLVFAGFSLMGLTVSTFEDLDSIFLAF